MLSKSAVKRALRARANARLDNHRAASIVLRSRRACPVKGTIDVTREDKGGAFAIELKFPSPNCEREQREFRELLATRELDRAADTARRMKGL